MMHHRSQLFLKVVHGIGENWLELIFNAQKVRGVLEEAEKCMLRHCPNQLLKVRPACIVATPYVSGVDHLKG